MKSSKFFLGIFFMLFFGVAMLFLYNKSIAFEEEETLKKHMDALLSTLNNKIEEITKVSLASSITLSKNPYVIECLVSQNREVCVEHLLEVRNALSSANLFETIRLHLHTSDFKSFVRLWDYHNNNNDSLSSFRHAFEKIKKTKRAMTGIEIGRHGMFIRAIAPVFDKQVYAGSIETVVDFKSINEYFQKDSIDFYVLMKNEYADISNAITYPSKLILDNYTIINRDTNGLQFIKEVNFQGTGYIKRGDYTILYTPIVDINGLHVGFFVLVWSENLSLSSFK